MGVFATTANLPAKRVPRMLFFAEVKVNGEVVDSLTLSNNNLVRMMAEVKANWGEEAVAELRFKE